MFYRPPMTSLRCGITGLTMTESMELQLDNGPRSSLSIGPRFGRCGGFRREFARRFTEGIEKLAGNTPGDHQGEDQKTCRKYVGGYRIDESKVTIKLVVIKSCNH
ncbi:hypothetical protein BHE74_00054734 [Ensete ventricosum]|nr:hypothetical protein BHE74_00054734 [Ensete ventricosum]